MLEGLDDIPWARLSHAYGCAEDVPDILRALAGGDDEALSELFGNIWHQGTVYEATAHAVPFLYEVLDASKADRSGILQLLREIATGSSYVDAHRILMHGADQAELDAKANVELGWVVEARSAVQVGAPHLLRWLTQGDAHVRECAAHVLGTCDASDPVAADGLERALPGEREPHVRASIVLALGEIGTFDARLVPALDGEHAVVQVAAAVAALRGGHSAEAIERLGAALPAAAGLLSEMEYQDSAGDPVSFVLASVPDWRVHAQLLRRWLTSDDAEVRSSAAFATERLLDTWRAAPAEMAAALAVASRDEEQGVRQWATQNLAHCAFAVPGLADTLWSLIDPDALEPGAPGLYALTTLVKLDDPRARALLLTLLDRGHPTGYELVGFLRVDDTTFDRLLALMPNSPAGNARISMLEKLGRPAAVPALLRQLDSHPNVVTRTLGDLGPAAHAALEPLLALRDAEQEVVRNNVARARWTIARDPEGVNALRRALDQEPNPHLLELLTDLARDGAPMADVLDRLLPWLDSADEWLRVHAAELHWAIARDPEPVVSALEPFVDGNPWGRIAARVLGEVGPPAARVAPRLREMIASERRVAYASIGESKIEADLLWIDLCRATLARVRP